MRCHYDVMVGKAKKSDRKDFFTLIVWCHRLRLFGLGTTGIGTPSGDQTPLGNTGAVPIPDNLNEQEEVEDHASDIVEENWTKRIYENIADTERGYVSITDPVVCSRVVEGGSDTRCNQPTVLQLTTNQNPRFLPMFPRSCSDWVMTDNCPVLPF